MPTQVRVPQIVIDVPKSSSDPFIMMPVQRIVYDAQGNVTQTIPRSDRLYRQISKVATEMVTFTDPVTQQEITISAAGAGAAITGFVAKWLAEHYDSTVDAQHRVMVD